MLCRSSLSCLWEGVLPLPSVDRIAETISYNLYFEKFFAVFAQKIRPRQGGSEKRSVQTVKKVPSSRHVRMDGTPTGKFSAESVRAAFAASARFGDEFCSQGQRR